MILAAHELGWIIAYGNDGDDIVGMVIGTPEYVRDMTGDDDDDFDDGDGESD